LTLDVRRLTQLIDNTRVTPPGNARGQSRVEIWRNPMEQRATDVACAREHVGSVEPDGDNTMTMARKRRRCLASAGVDREIVTGEGEDPPARALRPARDTHALVMRPSASA
jgi:hypothetical protein